MSAQFFVVVDEHGNISCKPAAEVTTRNTECWLDSRSVFADMVLAQADTQEQGDRFVALLRNQRAA